MTDTIGTMVSRLFADHCSNEVLRCAEDGEWPADLWRAIVDAGLLMALVEHGDATLGVTVVDAFEIVRLAGQYAVPVPLAETMLANRLLAHCGLQPQTRPLAIVADSSLRISDDGGRLTGTAASVPWGRSADIVVCAERQGVAWIALVGRQGIECVAGENMAREPRDHLIVDVDLAMTATALAPAGIDRQAMRAAGAALRCSQIAGALERVAGMTVAYAGARVQFGKPIAKFQAIQQNLAVLAEHAVAGRAAADMAAEAFDDGFRLHGIAAAKAFAGEAAGISAGIAHQVHGAMGFTREYPLHFFTKRLWAWREEYGNEAEWSSWLGRHLASSGGDQLWAEITRL